MTNSSSSLRTTESLDDGVFAAMRLLGLEVDDDNDGVNDGSGGGGEGEDDNGDRRDDAAPPRGDMETGPILPRQTVHPARRSRRRRRREPAAADNDDGDVVGRNEDEDEDEGGVEYHPGGTHDEEEVDCRALASMVLRPSPGRERRRPLRGGCRSS
jgi:hypothetical protein